MKIDNFEFLKQVLIFAFFSFLDLILFEILLLFCDIENAYLFAGMGLGFIFYNLAIKIGMIKND